MSGIGRDLHISPSQQIAWNKLWQKLLFDPSDNSDCCDTVPVRTEPQLKLVKSEEKPHER